MAISYDQRKKSYEGMDDTQKQQYNEAIKNKGDDYIGNQYMRQYQQANTPQSNNNSSNFNNLTKEYQDGKGWRSMDYDDWKKEYEGMDNAGKQGYSKFLDSQNDDYWGRGFLDTYKQEQVANANPELDTGKFGATDGKVSVKEGTAAQTGMPDYGLDSDARMNEIVNNLNAYWANNPEFFADRSTFNQMFHYAERDDKQKALLDTYWKKKQDMDKANTFTNADSISKGMSDADITPDQMNYIKEYSPEAYREWMQKQMDEINLRIANLATPADPTDNAELFNNLLSKLGLDPGDPYQIYDNWYSMCEQLGVFSDSEKLKSYQNQLDANHTTMESIMSRYANSAGGTASDALIAARLNKALAPYQQREVDLQNSYTTLLNGRNSNLAVANQSAQVLAMQAAEDQRVRSQRLQGLNFSMQTASYRTPEQQAQLQLQTAQIQNDMSLLQQAQANDLALYNQYATAKLQNQLQSELTDLSVTDPTQLRANLNNVLSSYYAQWGDIIKRPQSQVIDDVLAYAQEKGISVAQALKENFIDPLQSKTEYKNAIASKYASPTSNVGYSKITINGKDYLVSGGKIIDPATMGIGTGDTSKGKPYNIVSSETMENGIDAFAAGKNKGDTGGQCGKFVNDYLVSIGVTDADHRYFGKEDVWTRAGRCNSQTAAKGAVAVFNYNHLSDDQINHGHVAIVTEVYDDGSFDVIESNFPSGETVNMRHIDKNDAACLGFINYSLGMSSTQGYNTKDPYSGISGYTSGGIAINNGGWIDSLESVYGRSWANAAEMKDVLADYGLSQVEYNEQKERYMNYVETQEMVKSILDVKERAEQLKEWAQKDSSKNLKNTEMKINVANQGYATFWQDVFMDDTMIEDIQEGKALYDNLMSNAGFQKYLDMKANGAQFGIMTDSEWRKVDSSVAPIAWEQGDTTFMNNLNAMIEGYDQVLTKLGYDFGEGSKPKTADQVEIKPQGGAGSGEVITMVINGVERYSYDGGKTRY